MSLTPSSDVPTGHLVGVAYLNSPTKSSRLSSASRPVPPTPRKMLHRSSPTQNSLPSERRRRSFISAIPRPSSGSSRQASPSNLRNKPLPRLPKSESMLPYSQRIQDDLTGIRQQLPVRRYVRKALGSPSEIQSPSSVVTPTRLPKSATSASLSTHAAIRKITPGRRLLGPIHPPLPHSQSTSNIPDHVQEPEVSVDEAIHESRMTQDEIELLNQVQKEAIQNHTRFRAKYGTTPQSPRSPLSDVENLSTTRNYNAALVVDTELANGAYRKATTAAPTKESETHDGTSERKSIDPRHVYFAQNIAYWAGRYMAISDRLRSEVMEIALAAGSDTSYESREKQRMLTALYELRSYCKTDKARISFEVFEQQLKYNGGRSTLAGLSSVQSVSGASSHQAAQQSKTRVHQIVARSKAAEDTRTSAGPIYSPSAERRRAQMPLPNIWGRLALTKSKTTGNMASLTSHVQPPSQNKQPARPIITVNHRRRPSTQSVGRNNPAAIRESESSQADLRLPRAVVSHQRQCSNATVSSTGSTKAASASGSEAPQRPPLCYCRTSSRTLGRFDELCPGVSVSSIESGHPPAPPPPTNVQSPLSPRTQPTMVYGEKFVKSHRPKQRRSSGEAIRGFWSAGVEQVRKMGRRVGGSEGWLLSGDEDATMSASVRR